MQITDTTRPQLLPKKQSRKQTKIRSFTIDSFNYSEYELPKSEDRDFFEQLCIPKIIKGEPIGDLWKPLIFLEKTQKQSTDFVFIENTGIAMSQKAVEVLQPLIKDEAEILPLKTLADNPFFLVNTLNPPDALDEEKAIFQYSAVSKTKIGIKKFVFDSEKVKNRHFFKIKGFWYYRCISDEFQYIYKKHSLKGLNYSNLFEKESTIPIL